MVFASCVVERPVVAIRTFDLVEYVSSRGVIGIDRIFYYLHRRSENSDISLFYFRFAWLVVAYYSQHYLRNGDRALALMEYDVNYDVCRESHAHALN